MSRKIALEELKGMMDSGGGFTLVNVLDSMEFRNEHICGSINIPVSNIDADAGYLLDKEETVIVHCSGPLCSASKMAGDKLESLGFKDVRLFEGGIEEWKKAGYCLEGNLYRERAA